MVGSSAIAVGEAAPALPTIDYPLSNGSQGVEAGLAGSGATGAVGAAAALALPPSILNITVPQVGHLPLMALRPFFIVSSTPSTISFLALHLTQYPSGIRKISCFGASCAASVMERA
jgi:hypothetical protein